MNSSSLSHTKWKCQYHIVFIPKYRRKVLLGQLKADVREIIKKLCEYKNIEISALMIFDKHPELTSKWTKSFWARGYYVGTIGNVTEEAIKRYIQEQEEEARKEEEMK